MDYPKPSREPDIILPDGAEECRIEIWLKEQFMLLRTNTRCHKTITSVVDDYSSKGIGVEEYIRATLNYYKPSHSRHRAIADYYAEQILLGDDDES